VREARSPACADRALVIRPPLVLAYHSIGSLPSEHDPDDLMVPERAFVFHVDSLKARGYHFVKSSEFAHLLRSGSRIEGVCALTFDDGALDNAVLLPDLLQKLGVPATLFVCPGLLGRPHPWLSPQSGVRLVNAEELDRLSRLDFVEIGSHTNEHMDMSLVGADEAYREMVSSKRALEDLIGKPVESFAYPFCRYSPSCPAAAERAGYTSAAAGSAGSWDPYELRRELMDPRDGRIRFALKSRGAFRPIVSSGPGRLVRRMRRSNRTASSA
jgi:peptidoglycan/xylan/chitin deacetylase (PgdA/CDA1 family)